MKIAEVQTFLLHPLPAVPGLGIDIDVQRLRQRPYKAFDGAKMLTEDWEEFPRKGYVPGRPARV